MRFGLPPFFPSANPRKRRVVVEHTLERINDLIVERRLGMLRQSADEYPHRIHFVQLLDRMLGEDVHHSRRKSTVGNYGDLFPFCFSVERLLLEDDFSVAA